MKKVFLLIVAVIFYTGTECQVSYQSQPYHSNPYVQPLDLNLLRDVNTQKQNDYDHNSELILQRCNSSYKLITNYVSKLNFKLIADQYNYILGLTDKYDLSDRDVVTYINDKLNRLEYIIDFAMKNPTVELRPNVFDEAPTN